jgi:hypothetical protein
VFEGGAIEVKEIMNLEGEMRPVCRGKRHEWAQRHERVISILERVQKRRNKWEKQRKYEEKGG